MAVGTGIILQQGARATLREFVDAFKEAVLPAATNLRTLSESSLCLTVQAENKQGLKGIMGAISRWHIAEKSATVSCDG